MFSAFDSPDLKRQAFAAGAVAFLPKGCGNDRLRATLEAAVTLAGSNLHGLTAARPAAEPGPGGPAVWHGWMWRTGAAGRAHALEAAMSNLVPVVVEQTSRGERSFDLYSRLLAAGSSSSAPRSTTPAPT
jgi:hypothetical protein